MGMKLFSLHNLEVDVVVSLVGKVLVEQTLEQKVNRAVVAVRRGLRDQAEVHDRKDLEDAELENEGAENEVLGSEVLGREATASEVDATVVDDHRRIAVPAREVSVAVVDQEVVDHRAVIEVREALADFREEVTVKIEDGVNAENATAVERGDSGIVVPAHAVLARAVLAHAVLAHAVLAHAVLARAVLAQAGSDQIAAEKVGFPIEGQVAIAIRVNEDHAQEASANAVSVNAVQENEGEMDRQEAAGQEVHAAVNAVRSVTDLEGTGPEVMAHEATGREVMVQEATDLAAIAATGIGPTGIGATEGEVRADRVEDVLVVEAEDLVLVDFVEAAPAVDLEVAAGLVVAVGLVAAVVVGHAEVVVEEETKFEISLVAAA
jgi:hypothetical protein